MGCSERVLLLLTATHFFFHTMNLFSLSLCSLIFVVITSSCAFAQGSFVNIGGDASQLTGQIPAGVISASGVVTNLPVSNGTNDTAMFQAALNSGAGYINCAAWQSYQVGNLYVTNGPVVIDGHFASLNFLAGCTNAILDTGTNNNPVSISQLFFKGGDMQNYQTTASIPMPPNGFDIYHPFIDKRAGLYFGCGGGGYLKDCWFSGFSGFGVWFRNYYGTTAYTGTNSIVYGLYGDHNFISFEVNGFDFFFTGPFLGFAYDSAEYLQLDNCIAKNSGVGFMMSAGNTKLQNCQATANQFGYMAQGGPNSQHGSIDNMTLNHNTYPFLITLGGNRFHGLVMYANTQPGLIMNGAAVTFSGGCTWLKVTYPAILVTNYNAASYWSYASFEGNESLGASITNLVGVASTNSVVYFGGNFDPFGNTDLTSAKGLGMMTNSTGTGLGTVSYAGLDGSMLYGTLTNNTTGSAGTLASTSLTINPTNGAASGTFTTAGALTLNLPLITNKVCYVSSEIATRVFCTNNVATNALSVTVPAGTYKYTAYFTYVCSGTNSGFAGGVSYQGSDTGYGFFSYIRNQTFSFGGGTFYAYAWEGAQKPVLFVTDVGKSISVLQSSGIINVTAAHTYTAAISQSTIDAVHPCYLTNSFMLFEPVIQ